MSVAHGPPGQEVGSCPTSGLGQLAPSGAKLPVAGYTHYSLDDVRDDEGSNRAALAEVLSMTQSADQHSPPAPQRVGMQAECVVGAAPWRRAAAPRMAPPPRGARAVQLSHLEQATPEQTTVDPEEV